MEIDVNRSTCGASASVAFRYDAKVPDYDFSQVVPVPASTGDHGPTRIFMPVFAHVFKGIELSPGAAGCVDGAFWVNTDHRPLVLAATLVPEWESQPLYERLWFEPRLTGR